MNENIINKYKKYRRENPFLSARYCLAWAKQPSGRELADAWSDDPHGDLDSGLTKTVDGFTVSLRVEDESIYPQEGDGLGHYVEESRSDWHYPEWRGNYPMPAESFPLGLPYTTFRYSGPGWVQGEGSGYFVPDNVEDSYNHYRRQGQSKSVAWDLTKAEVERILRDYFSAPLTYCTVFVTVYKAGIELGGDVMGTSYIDNNEGSNYIFEMVEEHQMVETAIDEARKNVNKLVNN